MTKIIVDSTCDLPKHILEKYDIKVLPLRVFLNGKEFWDKVTIKVEEVYRAMKNGILPKTSLPNPIETYNLFEEYASNGIDFIFYSFSSKLSSTYQTTSMIIKELKEKYPNVKMEIIDTKAGAIGSGLIALQGVKLAQLGTSFDKIVKTSKEYTKYIEHIFTINDLSWLLKGGRINKSQAVIGNLLNIKPILHVKDGKMEVIQKIRGRKNH